jgi:HK97 family phage major capsid protein
MSVIDDKIATRARLAADAEQIFNGENLDTEKRARASAMLAEVTVLSQDIESLRQIAKVNDEQRSFEKSPRPEVGAQAETDTVETRKAKFAAAVKVAALHGMHHATAEQRDLLTSGTSGALVPQGFYPVLTSAQKLYGPIAQEVTLKETDNNGAPMKISLVNDTANGYILIGEGTAVTESDPTFQPRTLGTDTVHSGLVKITWQELEDSFFNLEQWISTALGIRDARGMEQIVTNGKDNLGTVLPNTAALTSVATLATTTASFAAGIGYDNLVAAYGAIDPAYLPNAKWVMNTATRTLLQGVLDGFGRPLFQPDPATSEPFAFLLGKPVVWDQQMTAPASGAVPILFGDLKASYMLRTDGAPQLQILRERYADTLETGFFLWRRVGGISLNAGTTTLVSIKQGA